MRAKATRVKQTGAAAASPTATRATAASAAASATATRATTASAAAASATATRATTASDRFMTLFSLNPDKRRSELFLLGWSPFWIGAVALVMFSRALPGCGRWSAAALTCDASCWS